MASKPKYKDAKTEYVRSPGKGIGLRKLADKWKIPFGTIGSQASKEHWARARKQYRNKVEQRADEAAINAEVDRAGKITDNAERSLAIASSVILVCMQRIANEDTGNLKPKADLELYNGFLNTAVKGINAVGNIKIKVDELYNIQSGGSDNATPEQFAAALVALAGSPGAISPIPRLPD